MGGEGGRVQGVGTGLVFPHVPPPFYTCNATYIVIAIEDIHGLVAKHLKSQTLFDLK